MRSFLFAAVSLASLAIAGLAPARSAIIDTFSFSDTTGWLSPLTFITGSFTGVVERDGHINLNDLTDFNISFSVSGTGPFGGV
jgi:hypothetical protein